MKKCLCLIISAFVLFSSFPCFAVSSASDSAQITADFDMLKSLGIFDGEIVTIPRVEGIKVPHIGWNDVKISQHSGIFSGIKDESYFYFVHSYYLRNAESDIVAGTTHYGVDIQCAVQRGKVCATQFHPEKSSEVGLQLLHNFATMQ